MTPHFPIWPFGPKIGSVDRICHQTDSMNRFYLDVKTWPYHVLRRCTRGDNGVYLQRAGPGAMGPGRYLKGYDRASKWYSEKQRGTVLGSEMISLVSCHMTYKPSQADSLAS